MEKAYVERCNGSVRRELLNAYVFRTLSEVRQKAEEWKFDYNHHRPHQALNFRARWNYWKKLQIENSTFTWLNFQGSLHNC